MINLLPLTYKQQLRQEWQFRALVVLSIALLAALIALSLLLLSVWIYLKGAIDTQKTQYMQTQDSGEERELQDTREEIRALNHHINSLFAFYQGYSPAAPVLEELSREIPDGITLSSVNYTFVREQEGSVVQLSIAGVAAERTLLGTLRTNLQAHPRIKSVDLPASDLTAGPTNVQFSVHLEIEPVSHLQIQQ